MVMVVTLCICLFGPYSNPTGRHIDYPALADEELEGGEGCHLPKVTQLVRDLEFRTPDPPYNSYMTLWWKKFKSRRTSSLSSPWIHVQMPGRDQLTYTTPCPHPAWRTLTTHETHPTGGSQHPAWMVSKAADLRSRKRFCQTGTLQTPWDRKCF